MKKLSIKTKGSILSVLILLFILFVWHIATAPKKVAAPVASTTSSEYQALMGQSSDGGNSMDSVPKSGFPTLTQMGQTFVKQLSHP